MVATHVLDPTDADGSVTTVQWLAGGRASALFAVLAGVSLALVTGGRRPERGAPLARSALAVVVRGLLVAVVGLALGGLESGLAVILTYYGVMFVLAVPFLGLGARPLLWLAVGWAAVVPVLSWLVRPGLPERGFANPSFDQLLTDPARMAGELMLTGYYPAVPWLAYLLLGLALGRLDLGSRRVAATVAASGLAVAVAVLVVSPRLVAAVGGLDAGALAASEGGMYGQVPTDAWQWLLVAAPHSTTPFDLLQTGGSAAFVLGLCLLVVGLVEDVAGDLGRRTVAVLFGAGTATLSLYSLHVVMRTEEVWPREDPSTFGLHLLVLLWVGALLVAFGRRGPLEHLVAVPTRFVRGR
ncbi:MAG: hypothetical protein CMH83_16950 [Nocardioides sp.]|nr:hypothetical protein [Nocardioides sp.]